MKNKNKTVWSARFNNSTSKIFEKIGASIDIDKRLFEEDILGSIVHTQMLIKQKIIVRKKGNRIIKGLKKIRNEIRKNKFNFNKQYEDIHLNIQKLEIFFDNNLNFVKEFKLKGMPTTILINKKGEEFARIIGEVDFRNAKFLKWLSKYD